MGIPAKEEPVMHEIEICLWFELLRQNNPILILVFRGQTIYGAILRKLGLEPSEGNTSLWDQRHLRYHSYKDVVFKLTPRSPLQPTTSISFERFKEMSLTTANCCMSL